MPTDRRRQLGAAGEQLAADHLTRCGFRILDRNYRTRWGELDIIACDEHQIVFCEVKCRIANRAGRDPLESVHPSKRTQVRRMAGRWLSEREHPHVRDLRFDAIGVTLSADGKLLRLDHLEAAF
jgi:putative endonuclease